MFGFDGKLKSDDVISIIISQKDQIFVESKPRGFVLQCTLDCILYSVTVCNCCLVLSSDYCPPQS